MQFKLFTPPPPVQLPLFQKQATPAQAQELVATLNALDCTRELQAMTPAKPSQPPRDERWRRWPPPWNKETPADRRIARQYKPDDTGGMF